MTEDTPTQWPRERAGLTLPLRIGPCLLLEPIGKGGMGTVGPSEMLEACSYAGRGRRVAVKLLEASYDPQRFAREKAVTVIERAREEGGGSYRAAARVLGIESAYNRMRNAIDRHGLHFLAGRVDAGDSAVDPAGLRRSS